MDRWSYNLLLVALFCVPACGGDAPAPDAGGDAPRPVSDAPLFGEVGPTPSDAVADADADADMGPEIPSTGDAPMETTSDDVTAIEDAAPDGSADADDGLIVPDIADVQVIEDTSEVEVWDGTPGVTPTGCEGLDNGTPCEDGDLCTLGDTCLIGACQPGEPTVCDGQGPCRVGTCAPSNGTCSYVDAPADSPCDDGDACTAEGTCQSGLCAATEAVVCPDQGQCQVGSCDPAIGCVYEHLVDGMPCDAPCHDVAACAAGICVGDPDAIPPCPPPAEPCVDAWLCDPATGECSVMVPVDAGATCDVDASECTLEACDGEGGCLHYDDEICEFESSFDPCWSYVCDPDKGCQKSAWDPSEACPGPVCGDSYCMEGEDCFGCPGDCGDCCGDGACSTAHEETCDSCQTDCGDCCGNGQCDFG